MIDVDRHMLSIWVLAVVTWHSQNKTEHSALQSGYFITRLQSVMSYSVIIYMINTAYSGSQTKVKLEPMLLNSVLISLARVLNILQQVESAAPSSVKASACQQILDQKEIQISGQNINESNKKGEVQCKYKENIQKMSVLIGLLMDCLFLFTLFAKKWFIQLNSQKPKYTWTIYLIIYALQIQTILTHRLSEITPYHFNCQFLSALVTAFPNSPSDLTSFIINLICQTLAGMCGKSFIHGI